MGTSTTLSKTTPSDVRRVLGEEIARNAIEERFPRIVEELLASEDDRVKLETVKFLYEQAYGKPRMREATGVVKSKVEVRFDITNRNVNKGEVFDAEIVGSGSEDDGRAGTGVPTPSCV